MQDVSHLKPHCSNAKVLPGQGSVGEVTEILSLVTLELGESCYQYLKFIQ